MKTQLILKTAVVAMAAFGAYAFNGNVSSQSQFSYKDGDDCINVNVACSDIGGYTCRVELNSNSNIVDVWDLECFREIKHTTSDVLPEM